MRLFFFISMLCLSLAHAQSEFPNNSTQANNVLNKMSEKLNSLQNISYQLSIETNYPSQRYHNSFNESVFYDLQNTSSPTGFKLRTEDSTIIAIYYGDGRFGLNKKEKAFIPNHDKEYGIEIYNNSGILNSVLVIKNITPILIKDVSVTKTIEDTLVNNKSCYLISCNVGKRTFNSLGNKFIPLYETDATVVYKIILDKKTYIPFEVLQTNTTDNDYTKTSFSNIKTNIPPLPTSSWDSTYYITEYKPAKEVQKSPLLAIGSMAPDWKLKPYNKDGELSLKDLKGKVILLDFFFKDCPGCKISVSALLNLHKEFKDKDFQEIGITIRDSKEDMIWFCNKYKIPYNVLLDGKETSDEYNVSGFPTFYVIDKDGKISFSQEGFDDPTNLKTKLEQAIQKCF